MTLCFSIKDNTTKRFTFPFEAYTKEEAIRKVATTLEKQDNMLSKHPDHFELYQTASFDEMTGKIHPIDDFDAVFVANLSTIAASIKKD